MFDYVIVVFCASYEKLWKISIKIKKSGDDIISFFFTKYVFIITVANLLCYTAINVKINSINQSSIFNTL